MKRATKIFLIIAAVLVVVGLATFSIVMSLNDWNFRLLSSDNYVNYLFETNEKINSISICGDVADVNVLPSRDNTCRVIFHQPEEYERAVGVLDGGALIINLRDTRKWYERISFFSFDTPSVTVYLPQSQYSLLIVETDTGDVYVDSKLSFNKAMISTSTGDVEYFAPTEGAVEIDSSTGDIKLAANVGSLDIEVTTGKIAIENTTCKGDIKTKSSTGNTAISNSTCINLISAGTTGDIKLKDVVASGNFSIKRDTGDVEFEACDASSVKIETDTGRVNGSFLTDKIIFAESDTGRINVPKLSTGGICKITTDTGDIKIIIK